LAGLAKSLGQSLGNIRKRLGGADYQTVNKLLVAALKHHSLTGNSAAHREWIAFLLARYYDPMYDYQLSLKQERIVAQGKVPELVAWLRARDICQIRK
jgi:tRNA 2-selenouridine synthase